MWRAKHGRIPSAVALKLRGVTVPSIMCCSCNLKKESSDHILLICPLTKAVMDSIFFWCEISYDGFDSVKDMLLFISRWSKCKKKRKLLNVILCGVLWCI